MVTLLRGGGGGWRGTGVWPIDDGGPPAADRRTVGARRHRPLGPRLETVVSGRASSVIAVELVSIARWRRFVNWENDGPREFGRRRS